MVISSIQYTFKFLNFLDFMSDRIRDNSVLQFDHKPVGLFRQREGQDLIAMSVHVAIKVKLASANFYLQCEGEYEQDERRSPCI